MFTLGPAQTHTDLCACGTLHSSSEFTSTTLQSQPSLSNISLEWFCSRVLLRKKNSSRTLKFQAFQRSNVAFQAFQRVTCRLQVTTNSVTKSERTTCRMIWKMWVRSIKPVANGSGHTFFAVAIIKKVRPPNVGVSHSNQHNFLQHSEEPYNKIHYTFYQRNSPHISQAYVQYVQAKITVLVSVNGNKESGWDSIYYSNHKTRSCSNGASWALKGRAYLIHILLLYGLDIVSLGERVCT